MVGLYVSQAEGDETENFELGRRRFRCCVAQSDKFWYGWAMTTLSITLRDEDGHFIENAVQSGSYLTQSEVVATALELLKTHEELRQVRREHLKKEVLKGIDELDKGETVEFTAPDIQRLGRERLASEKPR
jgi:antitoxin ParD1/3/4